jgi:hypothetical protein
MASFDTPSAGTLTRAVRLSDSSDGGWYLFDVRAIVATLTLLAFVFPAVAAAQGSGYEQYQESVPGAGGNQPAGAKDQGGGGAAETPPSSPVDSGGSDEGGSGPGVGVALAVILALALGGALVRAWLRRRGTAGQRPA